MGFCWSSNSYTVLVEASYKTNLAPLFTQPRVHVLASFISECDFIIPSWEPILAHELSMISPLKVRSCATAKLTLNSNSIDLTGLFCTSRREREFTRRTAGYAKQEVQGRTDRDVTASDRSRNCERKTHPASL